MELSSLLGTLVARTYFDHRAEFVCCFSNTPSHKPSVSCSLSLDWQKAKAFIFVIDSSDRDRLAEAHDEFHKAVYEQDIEHIPVLVLANKQDLPKCMSLQEVCQGLQLGALPFLSHGLWLVQGCCAITGQGLFEGLAWLASALHL
eukprot:TRINITY_DN2403_c0_g1_i2.p1 TRINITY_DN2403_c0_g1~~TRINITY_DN2403_c0_g1_i2.p1  ORF type:complete len:145 (-),score=20.39 TRINITY_DN2403_c0_g1_i2:140-574(-)